MEELLQWDLISLWNSCPKVVEVPSLGTTKTKLNKKMCIREQSCLDPSEEDWVGPMQCFSGLLKMSRVNHCHLRTVRGSPLWETSSSTGCCPHRHLLHRLLSFPLQDSSLHTPLVTFECPVPYLKDSRSIHWSTGSVETVPQFTGFTSVQHSP